MIVGMYGGSFNPIHNGHVKCIKKALLLCDELHIIIGNIPNMDDFTINTKLRWFRTIFYDEIENSKIVLHSLSDNRKAKSEYTLDKWLEDSIKIKRMVDKPINIVFAGTDYNTVDSPYKLCYPNQRIIYFDRDDDISSSEFKKNIELYKNWVPECVYKSYLCNKPKTI